MPSIVAQDKANRVGNAIEGFEKACQSSAAHLKKIRDRIGRFKKTLVIRSSPNELEKLVGNLQALTKEPSHPNLPGFIDQLQKLLSELRQQFVDSFQTELRRLCSDEQLTCKPHANGLGIGPFLLSVNAAREQSVLSYAKVDLVELPLNADECLAQVKQWKADILDQPVDLTKTRTCLEEALRVAAARRNKIAKGEIRVDLPQLFREVQFIKQGDSSGNSRSTTRYTLPRFVVELSRLVQSDENLDSKQPLRLETAVLENTRDSRRSIFLPKDLDCGFGEGTYYQALNMRTE